MPQKLKYKSRYVYWDLIKQVVIDPQDIELYRHQGRLKLPNHLIRFDSVHEYKVYLQLCRIYGSNRIVRQYQLGILPSCRCHPRGKKWKVDFAIISPRNNDTYCLYVEAKGAFLPEFAHTLACLEVNNTTAFQQTFIVFSNNIPIKNQVVKSLLKTDFKHHLLTLNQLKERNNLL